MISLTRPFNQSRSLRILYPILLGTLLLAAGVFLLMSRDALYFPFQLDYGEGPLLDRAVSLQSGKSLKDIYSIPEQYPYHIVNYPPLFFMLVAPFIDPNNPVYTPGRVLSLIAILIVSVDIFLIVKKLTDNRYAGVISALILLANPIIAFWSPYFRVDFLALAFSMTGLAVLLYWHHTTPGLLLSVVLIVAGAYTRQTYIVCAPLAGFAYLFPHSPRRAGAFVGLIAALGLSMLLIMNIVTDSGFWFHVGQVYLAGGTPVSWEVLLGEKWGVALLLVGPSFIVLMFIFFWRYSKHWFITMYTLGSFVSILSMAKAGSNFNYVIELIVAFSLITGVFVERALRGGIRRWQQNLFFGFLILQVLHAVAITTTGLWLSDEVQAQHAKEWTYLAEEMVKADGKVLTDVDMGILTQHGYPILFEPFDFSQMARKGLWDQRGILQDIEQQSFSLVVLQIAPEYITRERWTDEMLQAFDTYYVESGSLPWCRIYRPRESSAALIPPRVSGKSIDR